MKNRFQNEEYESIIPTAVVTSYPRTFTDIPYENEIFSKISEKNVKNIFLDKMLAPELEARYKLANKLLNATNIKQVLELASGYSSRGLDYSNKGYIYVEMDLPLMIKEKVRVLKEISSIPSSLHLISGNALQKKDYKQVLPYFDENQELVIINEGLLRYLTFEEKEIVAKNIYDILSKFGGYWITCDVTPKKFIEHQNANLPKVNANLSGITSRNSLNDRFEDITHIKDFFTHIGFQDIEIHPFNEVRDELSSPSILGLDNSEFLLKEAIVAVMRVNKNDK